MSVGMELLKKLKVELSYSSAIPFLGIYPEEPEAVFYQDMCAQTSQLRYLSTDEWIKKIQDVDTMKIYASVKKTKLCLLKGSG